MADRLPAVAAPVIERVLLCDLYERLQTGVRTPSTSQPGHLIQLNIAGRTHHEINGRRYAIRPGSLIWYHEDEMVRIEVLEAPWRFFSVNFIATQLSPPAFEDRVRQVGPPVRRQFDRLLESWRDLSASPAVREMRVQSRLLGILADLSAGRGEPYAVNPVAQLWWRLETELRRDLSQPIDLPRMEAMTGKSQATIARACRSAVGVAPMKRIKQIRMSLARGLVMRSELTMTQIAQRIGYGRVHEFSRDFRRQFGAPPTVARVNDE